jgi:hypothetical protein
MTSPGPKQKFIPTEGLWISVSKFLCVGPVCVSVCVLRMLLCCRHNYYRYYRTADKCHWQDRDTRTVTTIIIVVVVQLLIIFRK